MPACIDNNDSIKSGHLLDLLTPFKQDLKELIADTGLPKPKAVIKATHKYGCGFFGCVYATENPNIVFKITTDASEAGMVQVLKHISENGKFQFPGIAEYYGVWVVPAVDCMGRQVFCLWREEADSVGFSEMLERYCFTRGMHADQIGGWAQQYACRDEDGHVDYDSKKAFMELRAYLTMLKDAARIIRDRVFRKIVDLEKAKQIAKDELVPRMFELYSDVQINSVLAKVQHEVYNKYNTLNMTQQTAFGLAAYFFVSSALSDIELGPLLSECFLGLYEAGIILGDVHTGNLGFMGLKSKPPGYQPGADDIRITDPGLFVPITNEYDNLPIDILHGDNTKRGLFTVLDIPQEMPELPEPEQVRGLLDQQFQTIGF